jgi:hypothetical protein
VTLENRQPYPKHTYAIFVEQCGVLAMPQIADEESVEDAMHGEICNLQLVRTPRQEALQRRLIRGENVLNETIDASKSPSQ